MTLLLSYYVLVSSKCFRKIQYSFSPAWNVVFRTCILHSYWLRILNYANFLSCLGYILKEQSLITSTPLYIIRFKLASDITRKKEIILTLQAIFLTRFFRNYTYFPAARHSLLSISYLELWKQRSSLPRTIMASSVCSRHGLYRTPLQRKKGRYYVLFFIYFKLNRILAPLQVCTIAVSSSGTQQN